MDRSTLKALAIGLVALFVVILIAGLNSGGISDHTRSIAAREVRQLDQSRREIAQARASIDKALGSYASVFSDTVRANWKSRLQAVDEQLAAADTASQETLKLLNANDESEEAAILNKVNAIRAQRFAATAAIGEMATAAKERIRFADDRPKILAELERAHAATQGTDIASLRQQVASATSRWPAKKSDLEARLIRLDQVLAAADQALATARKQSEVFTSDPDGADIEAFLAADRLLREHEKNALAVQSRIPRLIAQLDVSWDEILVDMRIADSGSYQFFHKIKRIITPAAAAQDDQALEPKTTEREITVDKRSFEANEKNLGMVLRHKAAGKYDSEAESRVQPPGFAYMAPKGERNRYGYWDSRRGGGSFWVWYGQYSLMRDLFYGPRYGPIYYSSWNSWHGSYRAGRPWYGSSPATPRWGSSGSFASSRYASSSYKRNSGYTGNQWRSSGNSFRTSRYSGSSRTGRSTSRRPSSSSSSRGGYRSFRSSGSRSYGGK